MNKFAPREVPLTQEQIFGNLDTNQQINQQMDDFQEDDFIEDGSHEGLLEKIGNFTKELNLTGANIALDASGVGQAYNALKDNPLSAMTEFGASLAGHKRPFEGMFPNIPQPESGLGKAAVLASNLVPLGYGVTKLGKAGLGGLKSIFGLKSAMKGLSSTIGETVPFAEQAIAQEGSQASKALGNVIQNIKNSGIKHTDIDSWLDDLVKEIDPSLTTLQEPESIAVKIMNLKSGIHGNPSFLSGAQLQSRIQSLKQALGQISSKTQGAFTPIMEKGLSKTSAGRYFRMGQKTYESSMKSRDVVEQMTKRTILHKIAKGNLDESELLALKTEAQKYPGLSQLLDDVIKGGSKVRKVKSARGLAKVAGYTAGGVAGLNFLRSLIGGNNIQNISNVFQGMD